MFPAMKRALGFVLAALPLWSVGCEKTAQSQPAPYFEPSPPTVPRLTSVQYRNTVKDVFGGALPATALEPDTNPCHLAQRAGLDESADHECDRAVRSAVRDAR